MEGERESPRISFAVFKRKQSVKSTGIASHRSVKGSAQKPRFNTASQHLAKNQRFALMFCDIYSETLLVACKCDMFVRPRRITLLVLITDPQAVSCDN